jgi:Phosphatidylinositol-4-phosphate 5-Kinase
MGINQQKTLIQQAQNFFAEEEEVEEKVIEQDPSIKKVKNCSVCKVQKMNHLMREFTNNSNTTPNYTNASGFGIVEERDNKEGSFGDNIRQQMLNLAPRDVIE